MREPIVFEIPNNTEGWQKNNWRKAADALNAGVILDNKINSPTSDLMLSGSKVKISSADNVSDYLNLKLIAGTGITLTKSLTGGHGSEILTIDGHVPVTLGAGSAAELTLSGQELTLAAVLTPDEHTSIGDSSPHHAAVTLATNHGLGLTGQVLNMGTPSTCTAATTNAVTTTTHTHAITGFITSLSGYLKADGTVPLTADWLNPDYSISALNLTAQSSLWTENLIGEYAISTWASVAGWTWDTDHWNHITGNATALVGNFPCSGGAAFQVEVRYTSSIPGDGLYVSFGNDIINITPLLTTNAEIWFITGQEGGYITITPGPLGTWVGSIDYISIKDIQYGILNTTSINLNGGFIFLPPSDARYFPSLCTDNNTGIGMNGNEISLGVSGTLNILCELNKTIIYNATLDTLSGILVGTTGVVSAITNNSSNWNSAYGWGNHASAGYLTSVTAHDLLSTTHGDATAASVVRGDIIIGSGAAPNTKWTRFAVGGVGTYLAGSATEPSWATLNQAAISGLTTTDGPSFAHIHLTDAPATGGALITAAGSWIGPSATTGIYFYGGRVGIGSGTGTPESKLEIIGLINSTGYSATPGLATRRAVGTIASPSATQKNDLIGSFYSGGYGTTAWGYAAAGLFGFYASENFTDTANGTYFVIGTTTNGSASRLERLRIDNAGKVGIGTTLSAAGVTYQLLSIKGNELYLLTSSSQEREVALWTPAWVDSTDATRKGRLTLQVYDTSARTCIIAEGDGAAPMLGFFGVAAVNRPDTVADPAGGGVVDAEARTAINAVIDRLQELGLVT